MKFKEIPIDSDIFLNIPTAKLELNNITFDSMNDMGKFIDLLTIQNTFTLEDSNTHGLICDEYTITFSTNPEQNYEFEYMTIWADNIATATDVFLDVYYYADIEYSNNVE